jgi:ribosomal protein L22
MQNNPGYIPSAAPYRAQDAVSKVVRIAFARRNDLQHSVKKLNLVARVVRRMHIDDALIQLAILNRKKAARLLTDVRC